MEQKNIVRGGEHRCQLCGETYWTNGAAVFCSDRCSMEWYDDYNCQPLDLQATVWVVFILACVTVLVAAGWAVVFYSSPIGSWQ